MKLKNHLKTIVCLAAAATLIGCVSPGTTYTRSTGRTIDDRATTSRVKSAIAKDSLVKASEIDVSTFRGNVHLTGFVDHPIQKERAAQITRSVDGVDWFKNDIIVKTELPSSSRESMATGQQMREPSGAAREQKSNSNWQKGSGEIDAAPGLERSVKSTGGSAAISEPAGANNDLSQRVNSELQSNGSASGSIRAENGANGKITLRGTVGNEAEKRSIESKVRSVEGVNDVDNELEVQNK